MQYLACAPGSVCLLARSVVWGVPSTNQLFSGGMAATLSVEHGILHCFRGFRLQSQGHQSCKRTVFQRFYCFNLQQTLKPGRDGPMVVSMFLSITRSLGVIIVSNRVVSIFHSSRYPVGWVGCQGLLSRATGSN